MDEALHELTTAAKLEPNDVNVHWRLGRLYKIMGRGTAAKAEFDTGEPPAQGHGQCAD